MLSRHISQNKHEYNVRRVKELNEIIKEKELELKQADGFFQTVIIKHDLRKLHKQLNIHGTEVLEFEYSRSINNNH